MEYELLFLAALLITVAVETLVLYLVLRRLFKRNKLPAKLIIFAGVFCSFATLPYAWFVLPAFIRPYSLIVPAAEISVALAEALMLWFILKISAKEALIASFLCNAASFAFGLLLFPLLGLQA